MKVTRLSPFSSRIWLALTLAALVLLFTHTGARAADAIIIKLGNPWLSPHNPVLEKSAHAVEARTNGRIKFEFYWAGSLFKAKEGRQLCIDGVVDMACLFPAYYADMILNMWFFSIPFLPDDAAVMAKLYKAVDKFPQLGQELTKYKFHTFPNNPSGRYDWVSTFPFKKLQDLKGRKIFSLGKYEPFWVKAAGATPVAVPSPERFQALQTRMVEGGVSRMDDTLNYKFIDAGAKYVTQLHLGQRSASGIPVMNQKKWNSLPADVQAIMDEEFGPNHTARTLKMLQSEEASWIPRAKKDGYTILDFPKTEQAKWAKLIEPTVKKYAADIDKTYGTPGLGAKFISFIQDKATELGNPPVHKFLFK